MKSAVRAKAARATAALAGRLSDAADGLGRAVDEAVRSAVLGLGGGPSPALVPVRVREHRGAGRR